MGSKDLYFEFILCYHMSSYVGIRIPDNIAEKMEEIVSKGLYRNRQDFILEALRDKLSKSPREEFQEVPA